MRSGYKPIALALMFSGMASLAGANAFPTSEIEQYLLIGTQVSATAVSGNNFELGANRAPVPSVSGFTSPSGTGPTIRGAAPNIPLNAQLVGTGISNDGNIAITSSTGQFNLQDIGLYANLGIRCAAATAAACDAGTSNSFWNDPNQFPNTFTVTSAGNLLNNNVDGFGTSIDPGAAVQSTRIDEPNSAGVFANQNFATLLGQLSDARTFIDGVTSSTLGINYATLSVTGNTLNSSVNTIITTGAITALDAAIMDGRPESETGSLLKDNQNTVGNTLITVTQPGLTVIDILADGDFNLQESSLIINGGQDSFVIVRVDTTNNPDSNLNNDTNFLVSNGNILVGTGGIGLNNVLFYSGRADSGTHFNLSNSVVNGVAFWSLGTGTGTVNFSNVQGCTQIVSDFILLSDVRLQRCEYGTVPEPGTLPLIIGGIALLGLPALARRWRRRP